VLLLGASKLFVDADELNAPNGPFIDFSDIPKPPILVGSNHISTIDDATNERRTYYNTRRTDCADRNGKFRQTTADNHTLQQEEELEGGDDLLNASAIYYNDQQGEYGSRQTLAGKFSRLAGKSLAGPAKVSNDLKIYCSIVRKKDKSLE